MALIVLSELNFEDRSIYIIAVIGLGYVGLPLLHAFATKYCVIGFDINFDRINELMNNIDVTNTFTRQELCFNSSQYSIKYTANPQDLIAANIFIITVPTPVNQDYTPDLSHLINATHMVGSKLKKNDIVIYESTVYPGVTQNICMPILEATSNLCYKIDFKVAYSPERINPADKIHTFDNINKIVGACDDYTLRQVINLYQQVITNAKVFPAVSIEVAEATKLIENAQRDLNIAFMNELAIIFSAMNIKIYDVLKMATTKWNFLSFTPGLVGGHCISVDPYYLTYMASTINYTPEVILAGRRINNDMSKYIVKQTIRYLIKHQHNMQNIHVIILGVSFKENCPDIRNSKVFDISNELIDYGFKVSIHDPVVDKINKYNDISYHSDQQIPLLSWQELPQANLIIIAVAHEEFKQLAIHTLEQKLSPQGIIFDIKAILIDVNPSSDYYIYQL